MTILILAHSDYRDDIKDVTAALEARGARVVRFDTDAIPTAAGLSLGYGGRGGAVLRAGREEIDLESVSAVWLRSLREGASLPEMDPDHRRAGVEAAETVLTGLLSKLGCFQLDPRERVRRADNKPVQLQAAEALGLSIPATLISNDPEAVRAFARSCRGGIITKMVVPHYALARGDEEFDCFYTTALTPEALEDLNGLQLCPMIFQEQVEKALELRVTVVGRRVFTAAIDSQAVEEMRVDWRREPARLSSVLRPYVLPAAVEEKLLLLLDHFGLSFGGIDLILTPDGRYVFLEVNPLGSFSWMEHALWDRSFPISAAVADLLLTSPLIAQRGQKVPDHPSAGARGLQPARPWPSAS